MLPLVYCKKHGFSISLAHIHYLCDLEKAGLPDLCCKTSNTRTQNELTVEGYPY